MLLKALKLNKYNGTNCCSKYHSLNKQINVQAHYEEFHFSANIK